MDLFCFILSSFLSYIVDKKSHAMADKIDIFQLNNIDQLILPQIKWKQKSVGGFKSRQKSVTSR